MEKLSNHNNNAEVTQNNFAHVSFEEIQSTLVQLFVNNKSEVIFIPKRLEKELDFFMSYRENKDISNQKSMKNSSIFNAIVKFFAKYDHKNSMQSKSPQKESRSLEDFCKYITIDRDYSNVNICGEEVLAVFVPNSEYINIAKKNEQIYKNICSLEKQIHKRFEEILKYNDPIFHVFSEQLFEKAPTRLELHGSKICKNYSHDTYKRSNKLKEMFEEYIINSVEKSDIEIEFLKNKVVDFISNAFEFLETLSSDELDLRNKDLQFADVCKHLQTYLYIALNNKTDKFYVSDEQESQSSSRYNENGGAKLVKFRQFYDRNIAQIYLKTPPESELIGVERQLKNTKDELIDYIGSESSGKSEFSFEKISPLLSWQDVNEYLNHFRKEFAEIIPKMELFRTNINQEQLFYEINILEKLRVYSEKNGIKICPEVLAVNENGCTLEKFETTVYKFINLDGEGDSIEAEIPAENKNIHNLSVSEVFAFILDFCKKLQVLHGLNILHRDIKPENLGLTKSNEALLFDFGISKYVTSEERENVAQSKYIDGSSFYINPNIFDKGDKLSWKNDLYSVGCTIYELFAGRHYIDGYYDSLIEVISAHKSLTIESHLQNTDNKLGKLLTILDTYNNNIGKKLVKFLQKLGLNKGKIVYKNMAQVVCELEEIINLLPNECESININGEELFDISEEIIQKTLENSGVDINDAIELSKAIYAYVQGAIFQDKWTQRRLDTFMLKDSIVLNLSMNQASKKAKRKNA